MFKVGQKVRRVGEAWRDLKVNGIYTVCSISPYGAIKLEEYPNLNPSAQFFEPIVSVKRHRIETRLP